MPQFVKNVYNQAVVDVDKACRRSPACFVDRVSARKTQLLNPEDLEEEDLHDQTGLADYFYGKENYWSESLNVSRAHADRLNVSWAHADRAAGLEDDQLKEKYGKLTEKYAKEKYGTFGSTAHVVLHEDDDPFQLEKRPVGSARLSNVMKPAITTCNKALLQGFVCAQCGAHGSERPVVGVQMPNDIWEERRIKFVLFDSGEDDLEARSFVAADASVHAFIRQFVVSGAQAKEAFADLAYCNERQCRMAAGVLRVDEQAMFLQTGQNPRFGSNVRHGWKTSLLDDLCRLRLALMDPQLSDDMRELYRKHMPALVRHVRDHSYWMRNQEKQFVSTAVLLVIHCDAFGLCFGTDWEKESFVRQMAEAPKAAFDKLVTDHVLSGNWHGRTMQALKENQRIPGSPGSGCRTWFHTLSDGILHRRGWPTPMATAMVHRIVANFVAQQCPFDGARPRHQVRNLEEMRFWFGNQKQNDLVKGPFAAAVAMVGKLNNGRTQPNGSSNVYKAVAAAIKSTGAEHWMVKQLARAIGEPGRQDDALVRKSTREEIEYSTCDNSEVNKDNLDMPAQLAAIVHGLRMKEIAGTLIAKHLPESVVALAHKEGVPAGDYFLEHLLSQLVFVPMPRATDGNLFVTPTVVETFEEIQGALNPARRTTTRRVSTANDMLGRVLELARRPWAKPQRKKVLGRVTKLGMFVRERQQMPELLRAHLDAQDAVAMQAALFSMKVLLYALRGQRDSSGESEWVWGPKLKTKAEWEEFPVLASAPDPKDSDGTKKQKDSSALELLQTLDAAHAYFKELLEHHGPKRPAYYCHLHLMQPEHFLGDAAAIVEYARAMVKAHESRHRWIVPYKKNYTRALVDAARHLEAALLEMARPSRVPAFMQAASIRIRPCQPASCPELQRLAKEQWVANWRRDLADGTVTCSLEEYLTRDMDTPVRIAEQASAQLFERFEALRLREKLSGETFQQWKRQHRIDEGGLPFTDERFPTDPELARRKEHAERVAAKAQRRLTSRAMNEFSGKTKREEKNKYKPIYLKEASVIDEQLRAELQWLLSYKAPVYGPHPEQYTLYMDETHLRTGGAGRRNAQMRSAASNGRRNDSKVGADNGTAARARIVQVWAKKTPKARAAEREKLFNGLVGTFTNGEEQREKENGLAEAVRMAGLAKLMAVTEGGDDDADPEAEAVEPSPAKKAKSKTVNQKFKDMKAAAKAQQEEAEAHGFEQMHEGLRKVGLDGTVGEHASMMGAYHAHLAKYPDLSDAEKLQLLPATMRPKGYRAPRPPKAPAGPAPTKRTRRGRRVVVDSDSEPDADDEDDEPAIPELERAPALDEEDEQALAGLDDDEEEEYEDDAPAEGDDDDAGSDNADDEVDDTGQYGA